MQHSETNIANRIEVIDVLRGFALLGICLRHFISRFDYSNGTRSNDFFLSGFDRFVEYVDYHFLIDKTYPIFALLFGFSMFLVSQSSRGQSPLRSYKRLLGLIPFACLNAIFFPCGDILGLYVMVGMLVLLLVKLPLKWVPYLVVFFLLQPLLWMQVFINLIGGPVQITGSNYPALIREVYETIANGNLLSIIWVNLTKGQFGNLLWALEVGRVCQTIGLILLGYYLAQTNRFAQFIDKTKRPLRYLLIPVLVIIAIRTFEKFAAGAQVPKELVLIIDKWRGLSFAFIYIILIIFIYNRVPSRYFAPLSLYGRMSLTHYISQSIIGGVIFAPFALNGAAYLSNSSIVLLFMIVTVVQILFSKYWLAQNRYGPLERYWRRMSLYTFK
ncbi:DUF418 domain-containing protein [Niabella yanshanensis]|uniref:DUF418 domain-containing protein n=1 Tax=Niabella yanshanensis TaxID=577386 RepID=A0ABZ0VZC6_9BACT|nr:DUF418 domain-containing protein [Niabella yanshanensis]WQD36380.1 DUF418 domain-containing protein [Niabella yanshanensis]